MALKDPATVLDAATEWTHRVMLHEGLKRLANDAAKLRDDPLNDNWTKEALEAIVASIREVEVKAKEETVELGRQLDSIPFAWNPPEKTDE